MTDTFKVGDKVKHSMFGEGKIAFGPFKDSSGNTDIYLMAQPGGTHFTASAQRLTVVAAFTVGDKAKGAVSGDTYDILAGPFPGYDGDWYATKADGAAVARSIRAANLRPLPADEPVKVGDRVRVLRASYASYAHGKTGVVLSTTKAWEGTTSSDVHTYEVRMDDNGGALYVAELEKISDAGTHTFRGTVYDLSAKYRDSDGDVWSFIGRKNDAGVPYVTMSGDPTNRDTIEDIHQTYGALTKIAA